VTTLVIDHEIAYLPSVATLAVLRQEAARHARAQKSLAVFADPVFGLNDDRVQKRVSITSKKTSFTNEVTEQALRSAGLIDESEPLPRLPFSRQEADAITSFTTGGEALKALGFRANLATVTGGTLADYRIIHFATHAWINSSHPYFSGLVLSLVDEQGKPQDGFLSLNQIYNLNLSADLVVLSACQTATGKEIKGEGPIGLSRAFMYAGAPRVVASLWKVDDAATSEIVKKFYQGMLVKRLPPVAALRAAQIEMSKSKLWSSPFYWAGFVLQGEPN
jgi:CHAT domain-containing protein